MKYFLVIILLFCLASCDPGYRVYINNKSKNAILVEAEDPIESFLALKQGPVYDSIISRRVNLIDNKGLYMLKPEQQILLFGYIGGPSKNYFPYKNVRIIKGTDTIVVNPTNFLGMLVKNSKNTYFIDIN